jgi:hypothetical protein
MDKNLLVKTLRNTLGAAVYIFAVSQVMQNGDKIFGVENNVVAPFAFLLLFVLSASTVGGLVIGYPVYLFFDNKKKESVTALIYSIGWLALYTILVMGILALIK